MKLQSLSTAAKISIAALVLLGMVGGSLIMAHGGYETSPKGGGAPVFVPAPQGLFIAAMMYGMSVFSLVTLLRAWHQSPTTVATAIALYAIVAVSWSLRLVESERPCLLQLQICSVAKKCGVFVETIKMH